MPFGAFALLSRDSHAFILTFIGPVGVGKSTQIKLAKDYLKLRDIRVIQTFIKSNHTLTYILDRSLKAVGASEKVSYEGFTRIYPRRDIVRKLFSLWCFLDALSISTKFLFTVQIPFRLGFTPIIEEGLIMTFHTYMLSFPHFFGTKPKILPFVPNLLGWVVSKNNFTFVLDATDDELNQRRRSRNYRQNELPEYIETQRTWFRNFSLGNTIFVDTTRLSTLEVHKKIVARLEKSQTTSPSSSM